MKKIALLFDRAYIDTQHCFMELANQLAENGFQVDLYMLIQSNNHLPFFENQSIRILPFPDSTFQKAEYWSKILYAKDRKYVAAIGTPVLGAWVAYKTAYFQKIPYYYLADELLEHLLKGSTEAKRKKLVRQNYIANKKARATIALGEERYTIQKQQNKIDFPHPHMVLPNAQAGKAIKLRSNYFRDIFNIEDRKPILLFAGTLNWNLAKKIFEESRNYSDREYHLVFQSRTVGLMGDNSHSFIKMSTIPIPSSMMNYAVSSADIGLVLYDKESVHETNNGFTGGKIGTYLKNGLPLIAGSAENLRIFEEQNVGNYWDGSMPFDQIALKAVRSIDVNRQNIPNYYREHLQYEIYFEKFKADLLQGFADFRINLH
jgi:hypothetical protein